MYAKIRVAFRVCFSILCEGNCLNMIG